MSLLVLGLGTACSSFGSATTDTPDGGNMPGDASADAVAVDGGGGDGGGGGGLVPTPDLGCDLSKPFGKPVAFPAPISSQGTEDALFLGATGLVAYFSSDRGSPPLTSHLFFAKRKMTTSNDWVVEALPAINNGGSAKNPTLSADELTIYFESVRSGSMLQSNLWSATRASTITAFGAPTPLANVNTDDEETEPWLVKSGLRLYFSSDRNSGFSVFAANRLSTSAPFDAATVVAGLDGPDGHGSAVLTTDELTVFFSSSRAGGKGARDVWMATRATPFAAFGTPVAVPELNTSEDDFPTWLSGTGCTIIVESLASGVGKLFYASRPQ